MLGPWGGGHDGVKTPGRRGGERGREKGRGTGREKNGINGGPLDRRMMDILNKLQATCVSIIWDYTILFWPRPS
jgi:hypothetical protein